MQLKSAMTGIAVTVAFAVLSPTIARADGLLGSDVTAVLLYPNETSFCNSPVYCSGPIGPVLVTSGEFPPGTAVEISHSTVRSPSQIRR